MSKNENLAVTIFIVAFIISVLVFFVLVLQSSNEALTASILPVSLFSSHYMEWLNLAVRWFHIIAGIAWIGSSFYFNWLEGSLDRENKPEGIAGDLWAVHGGGFYYVKKYQVAPEKIPEKLHWFKYEAYFTWISGFVLLIIVYYFGARTFLIDSSVADISEEVAILIGIGSLIAGWFIYDLLCKSKLADNPVHLAIVGFSLAVAASYGLCQVFSSRGAYIHVGAILGTIMALNVFRVIIPFQKVMVDMALKGESVDGSFGKKASMRSLHNNYITLPVLFIMISNHYPMTYGHKYNWLILAAISFIGAAVRHYFNLKNKGKQKVWILPVAAAGMIALAIVTAPMKKPVSNLNQEKNYFF